jgi:beta-galactosidase/beta-glucuronidase
MSPRGKDAFATDTGFRSLVVQGNKFFLNGHPFVFKGVARHGLWANQGYTLTGDEIEQDFRMIKSMGTNSVRLVPYPHHPREIEAAERHGILVTQESGLTWIDFRNAPLHVANGINILERVVQRDWNNPAFWPILLANESTPTVEVMKEARQRIKALEPSILISTPGPSASDQTIASVTRLFDDADFDFYSAHPYTYSEGHFGEVSTISAVQSRCSSPNGVVRLASFLECWSSKCARWAHSYNRADSPALTSGSGLT